jgi:hypothetical protein
MMLVLKLNNGDAFLAVFSVDIRLDVKHRILGLVLQGAAMMDSTSTWRAFVTQFKIYYGESPTTLIPLTAASSSSNSMIEVGYCFGCE